jgi:hypothetical protein
MLKSKLLELSKIDRGFDMPPLVAVPASGQKPSRLPLIFPLLFWVELDDF